MKHPSVPTARLLLSRLLLAGLVASAGLGLAQNPARAQSANHDHRAHAAAAAAQGPMPKQAGQSAFAAIQEIVTLLEADPKTDWSKVDIEALRQHLIDMDAVTLHADVETKAIDGGLRFAITGRGLVADSIRRMTAAHAATMDGVDGLHFKAQEIAEGAALTVLAPPQQIAKLRALGFIGVMAQGMHHQAHHLMLARGLNPHH